MPGPIYCPLYNQNHYVYSNFFESEFAVLKFSIEKCNIEEREAIGKRCASDEEIDEYMDKYGSQTFLIKS